MALDRPWDFHYEFRPIDDGFRFDEPWQAVNGSYVISQGEMLQDITALSHLMLHAYPNHTLALWSALLFVVNNGSSLWMEKALDYIAKDIVDFPTTKRYTPAQDAASTYYLLDHYGGIPNATTRQMMIDWLRLRHETHFIHNREAGAMNRALAMASFYSVYGSLTSNQSLVDYAESRWDEWHKEGDIYENANGYCSLDLVILQRWCDFNSTKQCYASNDTKLGKLLQRYLTQVTPSGAMFMFGDSLGTGFALATEIMVWDTACAKFQYPPYCDAAQRVYQLATNDREAWFKWENNKPWLFTALMFGYSAHTTTSFAYLNVSPAPSTLMSTVTQRKEVNVFQQPMEFSKLAELTSEVVPDKVIFRTGHSRDATFAAISANTPNGHSHNDAGAVLAYTSHGSQLLTSMHYLLNGHEYHNTFLMQDSHPEVLDVPFWVSGISTPQIYQYPAGVKELMISFDAKWISGAPTLSIQRLWGGAHHSRVQLTPQWQHFHFMLKLGGPAGYNQSNICIMPSTLNHVNGKPANGEFLLDNLVIEDPTGQELARLDFEVDLSGSFPVVNSGTPTVSLTHETVDTYNGSSGAVRVVSHVGRLAAAMTWKVTVPHLSSVDDGPLNFGFAQLHMPNYLTRDTRLDRRVLFLGHLGMLVRDEVESTSNKNYSGNIGPAWNFGQLGAVRGTDWVNGIQSSVAIPEAYLQRFLTHFTNRPRDVLVKLKGPGNLRIDKTVLSEDQPVENKVWTNTKYRVWQQDIQGLPAGSRKSFASWLQPHSPSLDASVLAKKIQFVKDDEDMQILVITVEQENERHVIGMNGKGLMYTLPQIEGVCWSVETDAMAFVFRFNDFGKMIGYNIIQATELRSNGLDLLTATTERRDYYNAGPVGVNQAHSFDSDISGVAGYNVDACWIDSGDPDRGGVLKVNTSNADSAQYYGHSSGALIPTQIYKNGRMVFRAQVSLIDFEHEVWLTAQRPWGATFSRESVKLTSSWEVVELAFRQYYTGSSGVFVSGIDSSLSTFGNLVNSIMLIDDIEIFNDPNSVLLTSWYPSFAGAHEEDMIEMFENPLGAAYGSVVAVNLSKASGFRPSTTGVLSDLPSPFTQPDIGAELTFSARSVSGETCLSVLRDPMAVPSDQGETVQMTSAWKTFSVTSHDLKEGFKSVLFTGCGQDSLDGALFFEFTAVEFRMRTQLSLPLTVDNEAHGYNVIFNGAFIGDNTAVAWDFQEEALLIKFSEQYYGSSVVNPTGVTVPKSNLARYKRSASHAVVVINAKCSSGALCFLKIGSSTLSLDTTLKRFVTQVDIEEARSTGVVLTPVISDQEMVLATDAILVRSVTVSV